MKKVFSFVLTLTMLMSLFAMPTFAATASKEKTGAEFQPQSFTVYFYKDGSTVKQDNRQANNKETIMAQAVKLNEVVGSATVTITRTESGKCYMSWEAYSYGGYFIKEAKIKLLCKKSGIAGSTYYKKENSKKGRIVCTQVSGYTDLFAVPNAMKVVYGISDFNMTFHNYNGTVKAYNQMWETTV